MAAYRGLYINLDRSPERRALMEAQLARFGLSGRYARFPAVDGASLPRGQSPLRPGEIGVFHSHCRALESVRDHAQCLHILEDDALLSEHVAPVIGGAIAAKFFDGADLLFTDMVVHCHVGFLKNLKSRFDRLPMPLPKPLAFTDLSVIDLSQVFHAAFQSYVVGAGSIDKLLALYRAELANGPQTPVDIFVQQQVLAGKLRAACVFPFITSFRLEDVEKSTIPRAERTGRATVAVMDVLRYLFFLGADLDYAQRVMDMATRTNRKITDARHTLMAQAVEFVLSDDFGAV